jgi:hypothetical protein
MAEYGESDLDVLGVRSNAPGLLLAIIFIIIILILLLLLLFFFSFLPSRGALGDGRRWGLHEGVSSSPRGQQVSYLVSHATPIAKAPSVWNKTFNMSSSIGEAYAVRSGEGFFLQDTRKILSLPHGVS